MSLIKPRSTKGKNMGKGLSLYLSHLRTEAEAHDDVDAYCAPSECHGLVSRGEDKRFREVKRHIKATTGLKFKDFKREVKMRTSHLTAYKFGI